MKNKGLFSFCMKAIILLAIVLVVDKVVGFAFLKIKDCGLKTNPECLWMKTPYVVEKMDADMIIVGSSRAVHHYVPSILEDSLGVSVYNCGQDGCFFLYQNCIINMVLDRYRPKTIIWDIQPGCFNVLGDEREYQNIRYLSPYYEKSPWATGYINSEERLSSLKMKCRMFAYNSKLHYFLLPLVVRGIPMKNGYIPLPSEGYEYPELSSDYADCSEYESNMDKLGLFASTIERCQTESVEILIVVSPCFITANNAYLGAIADLQKVAAESGCPLYDYSNLLLTEPNKFYDNCHLNHNGAVAFTEMIINQHLQQSHTRTARGIYAISEN